MQSHQGRDDVHGPVSQDEWGEAAEAKVKQAKDHDSRKESEEAPEATRRDTDGHGAKAADLQLGDRDIDVVAEGARNTVQHRSSGRRGFPRPRSVLGGIRKGTQQTE